MLAIDYLKEVLTDEGQEATLALYETFHPSVKSAIHAHYEAYDHNGNPSFSLLVERLAADILNMLGTAIEGTVIESIREQDADLAQKITDKMFTFEDLQKLDNKSVQMVLKEVSTDMLVIALKGASTELKGGGMAKLSGAMVQIN